MDYDQIQADLGFTSENKAAWLDINAKYYEDPEQGWRDKLLMHAYPQRSANVYVMQGYMSPASNKWIETPRQRREDFKVTGTRAWEGMKDEKSHAQEIKRTEEKKFDEKLDHTARTVWQNMPDSKKQAVLSATGT